MMEDASLKERHMKETFRTNAFLGESKLRSSNFPHHNFSVTKLISWVRTSFTKKFLLLWDSKYVSEKSTKNFSLSRLDFWKSGLEPIMIMLEECIERGGDEKVVKKCRRRKKKERKNERKKKKERMKGRRRMEWWMFIMKMIVEREKSLKTLYMIIIISNKESSGTFSEMDHVRPTSKKVVHYSFIHSFTLTHPHLPSFHPLPWSQKNLIKEERIKKEKKESDERRTRKEGKNKEEGSSSTLLCFSSFSSLSLSLSRTWYKQINWVREMELYVSVPKEVRPK